MTEEVYGFRNGIDEAVYKAGGQTQLGEKLKVTSQSVNHWVRLGYVPNRRAVEIEELYGIARRRLVDPRLVALLEIKPSQ